MVLFNESDEKLYIKQFPPFGEKIWSWDICLRTLSVLRSKQSSESIAQGTMSYKEQIKSKDKYPSILSPQRGRPKTQTMQTELFFLSYSCFCIYF